MIREALVRRGIRHNEVTLDHLLSSERLFPHAGACCKARSPKTSPKMKGMNMKKSILLIMGAALATLVTGCSTTLVAFAPVGPNPASYQTTATNGQLEVFSALSERIEGDNPTWSQHSDYYLCDSHGRRLEHVDNNTGYYSENPRLITLPPDKYIVEARAKDVLRAKVPVVIKPGEITRVHLDGNWQPPAETPKTEAVEAPSGYPVGWRVD
jgi:hypothetical protein